MYILSSLSIRVLFHIPGFCMNHISIKHNTQSGTYRYVYMYCIRGLFGGDFNLVVWQIFIGLPNLNPAVLTLTHEMN